ncbi:WxL domain-containing protein [Erysipelothrix anatis]|uniref:WxL domain-containing protein n=1 Tax=Erysipelothrix anatis TaxID=2683713 RepID=UPI001357D991|nr:WxL domain-containing protein [Erysipelothrix anatis]
MKKTNTFLRVGTLSMLVAALAATPIIAQETAEPQTSEATASFTAPDTDKPVVPVDPTDPTKPLDPTDPDDGKGTGSTGPMTIDYVPHFKFKPTAIEEKVQTIQAISMKPFVQVSDRTATGKGWTLSASLGEFKNTMGTPATDDDHILNSASITLTDGTVASTDATNLNKPVGQTPITLTAGGGEVSIMQASTNNGMGTWLMSWLADSGQTVNSKVTLTADTKGARVGDYKSEINWTLKQQP